MMWQCLDPAALVDDLVVCVKDGLEVSLLAGLVEVVVRPWLNVPLDVLQGLPHTPDWYLWWYSLQGPTFMFVNIVDLNSCAKNAGRGYKSWEFWFLDLQRTDFKNAFKNSNFKNLCVQLRIIFHTPEKLTFFHWTNERLFEALLQRERYWTKFTTSTFPPTTLLFSRKVFELSWVIFRSV